MTVRGNLIADRQVFVVIEVTVRDGLLVRANNLSKASCAPVHPKLKSMLHSNHMGKKNCQYPDLVQRAVHLFPGRQF